MSIQDDFKFNGAKGDIWKGKIERYFFSRVTAICELFNWAEKEVGPITDEHLREAVGDGLCTFEGDGTMLDHTEGLNSAIWGFLANCTASEAQVYSSRPASVRVLTPGGASSE